MDGWVTVTGGCARDRVRRVSQAGRIVQARHGRVGVGVWKQEVTAEG